MPIVSVTSDASTLTLTAVGEYAVPVERLWAAWVDPRQLERFWGPPQWPATFTRHDVREGGGSAYHMTGPHGEISRGWWVFDKVEPERVLEVRDGFARDDGSPNTDLPSTHMRVTFASAPGGSRLVSVSTFASLEAMEQLLSMGMEQGLREAMGQMDAVLADLREAARLGTQLQIVDDTHVDVVREVRGSIAQVWLAHHDAALLKQWMLGPDGWTLPVCEVAAEVGDTYRYEWESTADGSRFGFTGELLELEPPWRAVTTERMIGTDGPSTENELVLAPRPGGRTAITVRITYPSRALRDQILATGMVDGMEASYARLEDVVQPVAST